MSDALEVPEDPAALVLSTGADVNPNRPVHTGDVFVGVEVPVLQTEPVTVMVVGHPCAIRTGGVALADRLHVAPISAHDQSGSRMWTGNYRLMALDALAEATGLTNPVVHLDEMTLVESAKLSVDKRVACLERYGIDVLRQRLVHQLTRVVVSVDIFDDEAAGAHEEVDLLEAWADEAEDGGVDRETASEEFHEWIRAEDRQRLLADSATAAAVRRATFSEMKHRYSR